MKVKDAIALLQTLPPDADLIPTSDPIEKTKPTESAFVNPTHGKPFLTGLSLEEIRKEIHDIVFFEKDNVAIFGIVVSSEGNNI